MRATALRCTNMRPTAWSGSAALCTNMQPCMPEAPRVMMHVFYLVGHLDFLHVNEFCLNLAPWPFQETMEETTMCSFHWRSIRDCDRLPTKTPCWCWLIVNKNSFRFIPSIRRRRSLTRTEVLFLSVEFVILVRMVGEWSPRFTLRGNRLTNCINNDYNNW